MQHSLTKDEVGRYSRQLLVNSFGVKGQEGLKNGRVLIVGAGGLGCPVATYLAGAGIGTVGVVDYDEVSIDNLHRQVAHVEANVGIKKTESLKQAMVRLNHLVEVHCHNVLLNSKIALDIIKDYDVICDCSDNAATRYLVNDACVLLNKPLVSGSALRWEGQLTVYNFDGGPCYRCLFPCPPKASLVTNCSEGGVLGPVVGVIGSMQALEVVKILSENPASFSGKLYLFDGLTGRNRSVALRPKSKSCAVCGENPTVTELIDYEVFCGAGANDKIPTLHVLNDADRVTVDEYNGFRNASTSAPVLLDTRPPNEFAIASLPEAKNVTLDEVKKLPAEEIRRRLGIDQELPSDVFVICHRGNDSQLAVEILKKKLDTRVRDIRGGYQQWADSIDANFPVY